MLTDNECALILAIIGIQEEDKTLYPDFPEQAFNYLSKRNTDTTDWLVKMKAKRKVSKPKVKYEQMTITQIVA